MTLHQKKRKDKERRRRGDPDEADQTPVPRISLLRPRTSASSGYGQLGCTGVTFASTMLQSTAGFETTSG